jgi:hypothetical protein
MPLFFLKHECLARPFSPDYIEIREGDDYLQVYYSNGGSPYFTIPEPTSWSQILSRYVRQICGLCGEATNEDDMAARAATLKYLDIGSSTCLWVANALATWAVIKMTLSAVADLWDGPATPTLWLEVPVRCSVVQTGPVVIVNLTDHAEVETGLRTFVLNAPTGFMTYVNREFYVLKLVRETLVAMMDNNFLVRVQLNGANGEHTGLDDMSGRGRGRGGQQQHRRGPTQPPNQPNRDFAEGEPVILVQQRPQEFNKKKKGREKTELPEDFKTQRKFNICLEIMDKGECDKCPRATARESVEIMRHFLAREGIKEPALPNSADFLGKCIQMLEHSQYAEMAEPLARQLRVVVIGTSDAPPPPLEFLPTALVNKANDEFRHAPPRLEENTLELSSAIKQRIDQATFDSLPETTVHQGHGIIPGCVRNLNIRPQPQFILTSPNESEVLINTANFHEFATQPAHPIVDFFVRNNLGEYETVRSAHSSEITSWRDMLYAFVPSILRPGISQWIRHPTLVVQDVTYDDPELLHLASTRGPCEYPDPRPELSWWMKLANFISPALATLTLLVRKHPWLRAALMLAVVITDKIKVGNSNWLTKAMLRQALSFLITAVAHKIFFTWTKTAIALSVVPTVLEFISDTDLPKVSLRAPLVVLQHPPLPTDPLELRRLMPRRNRLDPHSSNLHVGTVSQARLFKFGKMTENVYYCPELVYGSISVTDCGRAESTYMAAWNNLDSKNSVVVYPPQWRLSIQQSWRFHHVVASRLDPVLTRQLPEPFEIARPEDLTKAIICAATVVGTVLNAYEFWCGIRLPSIQSFFHFTRPPIRCADSPPDFSSLDFSPLNLAVTADSWVRDLTNEGIHPNPGP